MRRRGPPFLRKGLERLLPAAERVPLSLQTDPFYPVEPRVSAFLAGSGQNLVFQKYNDCPIHLCPLT